MAEEQTSGAAELRFSAEGERRFEQILSRYPNDQTGRNAALLPTLHLAQEEFGYVSVRAMEYVAKRLDIPPAKVLSVATFYTMYNRHPVGKYQINVCTSPPCYLMGSDWVVKRLEEKLGIKVGQTTADKRFTLGRAECLASCNTAPMLDCNGVYYENLTPELLDALIQRWSKDGGPDSKR